MRSTVWSAVRSGVAEILPPVRHWGNQLNRVGKQYLSTAPMARCPLRLQEKSMCVMIVLVDLCLKCHSQDMAVYVKVSQRGLHNTIHLLLFCISASTSHFYNSIINPIMLSR